MLRQRLQTNLNETALTDLMVGTTFEADELYQNTGKKYTPSRRGRPATATGQ